MRACSWLHGTGALALFRWTLPRLTAEPTSPTFVQVLPEASWRWLWRDVLEVLSGRRSLYMDGLFLFRAQAVLRASPGRRDAGHHCAVDATACLLYSSPSMLFVVLALMHEDAHVETVPLQFLRRFSPLAPYLPPPPRTHPPPPPLALPIGDGLHRTH